MKVPSPTDAYISPCGHSGFYTRTLGTNGQEDKDKYQARIQCVDGVYSLRQNQS